MYSKLKINLKNEKEKNYYLGFVDEGEKLFIKQKESVGETMKSYMHTALYGTLKADEIKDNCFPKLKANIFISHSHRDYELALGLAGWMYVKFNLVAFIDSCVWGYSNDLLKEIDNIYSRHGNLYNYEERNVSTSHIHTILQTSLYNMIDNVESIFLLNSENSLSSANEKCGGSKQKVTCSPWIYSEIVATNLLRCKKITQYRKSYRTDSYSVEESVEESQQKLQVQYDVDLQDFKDVNEEMLKEWEKCDTDTDEIVFQTQSTGYIKDKLDYLYEIIRAENSVGLYSW